MRRRAVHVLNVGAVRFAPWLLLASGAMPAIAAPATDDAPPDAWGVYIEVTAGRSAGAAGKRVRGRVERVRVPLPTYTGERWKLHSGLDYAYTRFEYAGIDGRNRDVHRLSAPMRLVVGPTTGATTGVGPTERRSPGQNPGVGPSATVRPPGARHVFSLAPTAASSSNVFKDPLNRATRRDFRVNGGWQVHVPGALDAPGHWDFVAGLRRDHRFGGPRTYPVAGVAWTSAGDAWSVRVALPDLRVDWHGSDRAGLWLRAGPDGERWAVLSDELDGARFRYRQRRWAAAVGGDVNVWSDLHAGLELGIAFNRRHRFVDDTGAAVQFSPGAAPFAGLMLEWRR